MSTRSQREKRRNVPQESNENERESMVSPIVVENESPVDQDVLVAGPSRARSPRVEHGSLESLRVTLKEKITSEIKNLLADSQKELLIMLKPKTGEGSDEGGEIPLENERRSFYPLLNLSECPYTSHNSSVGNICMRCFRRPKLADSKL